MTQPSDSVRKDAFPNFVELIQARLAGVGGRIFTGIAGNELIFEAELTGELSRVHVFLKDGAKLSRRDEHTGRIVPAPLDPTQIKKIIVFPRRVVNYEPHHSL